MRAIAILLFVWVTAGAGAVGVSILGATLGPRELSVGAAVGGPLGAVAGVWICGRLGWLAPASRTAAALGAAAGFLMAIPLAVANLHSPVVPIVSCSLAGVGALAGSRWRRARG